MASIILDHTDSAVFSQTRHKPDKEAVRPWLVAALLFLCLAACGELAFHFIIAPRLRITSIDIKTDLPLSKPEILRLAGVRQIEYYFSVNTQNIQAALDSLPMVRHSRVVKKFPNTLLIAAVKRVPLCLVLGWQNGQTVPIQADSEGVLFMTPETGDVWNLPVLSGIPQENFRLGMRLDQRYLVLLKSLEKLRESVPGLFALISEIKTEEKNALELECVLCFINHPVRIRIGNSLNTKLVQTAQVVLDVFQQQTLPFPKEIDFRTQDAVF